MHETEDLVKYQVLFLKPIRIMYDLMVDIFTMQPQTFPWQQYVSFPLNIIVYITVNVCYVVVISAQVLSYPVKIQIKMQKTIVQQYLSLSTEMYPDVHYMKEKYKKIEQHIQCIAQSLTMV